VRVLILYNLDEGLAHGEADDSLAAAAVLDAVRGVERACGDNGWDALALAAPEEPVALIAALRGSGADLVFNLVEALRGEVRLEAAVAWLYELCGVAYTGSPPLSLSLCLQKPLARAVLQAAGVPVPAGRLLERGDEPLDALRPPLIVKPSREDASHGITLESVARDEAAARRRARYVIERYQQPALVEEFIDGRELNVSILGEGESSTVMPLAEIDYSEFPAGPRLITYAAKWVEESAECRGSKPVAARDLDDETAGRVREVALGAYRTLGLRDYGRVDLRLDPSGAPFVLDVNSNPDISPDAGLAKAAARGGLSYPQLIARVVEGALARRR
jgi:D-alanine-D-alanine ligase